jgi:hypothetical protein
MGHKTENTGFICENCGKKVVPVTNGSYRNHCPFCLCSKHVDDKPGDRQSGCGGIMDPVGVTYKSGKGYQIIHKCRKCGYTSKNIVAEDTVSPDDQVLLTELIQKDLK